MPTSLNYDERVGVLDAGGQLLGKAQFNGRATHTGEGGWSWSGMLTEGNFALTSLEGKEVQLQFDDGSVRRAVCIQVPRYTLTSSLVRMMAMIQGNDLPPGVTDA